MARREAREYREYLSAEQRSQPGCPAWELCREPRGQDTNTRGDRDGPDRPSRGNLQAGPRLGIGRRSWPRQLMFHAGGAEMTVMADAPKTANPSEATVAAAGLEQGESFRDSEAEFTL